MKKYISISIVILLVVVSMQSCSDFDEINRNPTVDYTGSIVKPEYLTNNSILGAQQDPHIADRIFVRYWKTAGRMDRMNYLPIGDYNGSWTNDYYRYLSGWLKDIYSAVNLANIQIEQGSAQPYTQNLKNVARIWRAYLISEGVDNFGPFVIDISKSINPPFSSVEDAYYYMLNELKEASEELDVSVEVSDELKKLDIAYAYDFAKWKKYANSMRMRLAMRISEVAPEKAREHFEDAVSKGYIADLSDAFEVQEDGAGWSNLTGVFTRQWNMQKISTTINNLVVGLGGVKSENVLVENSNFSDLQKFIKDENYMGIKYDKHFATKTNDPSAGYWFDGLHNKIDPRMYQMFAIPGDTINPQFNKYPSWAVGYVTDMKKALLEKKGEKLDTLKLVDARYTWNAFALGDWGEKSEFNKLVFGTAATTPRLVNKLRDGTSKRVFFNSWESYFLIAEASVRGWSVPMSGKEAYEKGIEQSFIYWGVSSHLSTYLASEDYNRVGTSVSWSHTVEPSKKSLDYIDGYTGAKEKLSYDYPKNYLYKDGSVKNDLLTKIITQKFIAQTPWLPLEAWSDHRRLGLPFFENPAVEKPLPNLPALTKSNYMESKVEFFPQRLRYPSSLESNVPEGYKQAVELLGGEDSVLTPLWWAKK